MVGDILRQERERQDFSIKDIEQGTSIRALYIEAIENGDYDKLPGNVYTKGFIKNYGNFLKLDGDALSRQFTEEVAPSPPPVTTVEATNIQSSSATTDEASSFVNEPIPSMDNQVRSEPEIKISSSRRTREKSKSNSGLIIAAIVLIAAIAGGLWYYFTNIEGSELAQNPPAQTQSTEPSSTAAVPASASTPDSTAVPTSGLNLQAKFNDRCWTRVVIDGRIAYEGTPEAGQTLSWQANDRIIVTAGNAGAIEFIENGKSLGIAGAVGDVIEKTFIRK